MQIDISKQDIDLISTALESYEREAGTSNLIGEMFGAVLMGKEGDTPAIRKQRDDRLKETEQETHRRKAKCLMLRARLAEIASRETEFSKSATT